MADRLDAARDAALRSIYLALGGDETLLVRKRSGSDPRLDFVLADHALAVEVDEIQHFTTERLRTLDLYPAAAEVCFDTGAYRTLISRWCTTGDRYRAAKPTVDFPFAGGAARAAGLLRRLPRSGRAELRAARAANPGAGV